jgi:hypothetical protein
MRITGRQVYETMRIAMDLKKKHGQRDPTNGSTNDGTVTTQIIRKPSLIDILSGNTSDTPNTSGQTSPHLPPFGRHERP